MKPVSRTAFYCTGVRALDARKPNPVCGDSYAERFMDDEAWRTFEPFHRFKGPAISNATRHRIIDDLLRERLAGNPHLRVVIIGAGFDSRAYRLKGGRWLELDEPQVFAWKEPRLPASDSRSSLVRVPIDFAEEKLSDKLAPYAEAGPAVIVIEGVLFYLSEEQRRDLLRTLRAAFPKGVVLCDVMTAEFFNAFARPIHEKFVELGASFVVDEKPIADVFREEGYIQTAVISTTLRARELGQIPWYMRPAFWFSKHFREGYSIRIFEAG